MYQYFSGPAHGWLKVPLQEIVDLKLTDKISKFSYISDDQKDVYLEGDKDAVLFVFTKAGVPVKEKIEMDEHMRIQRIENEIAQLVIHNEKQIRDLQHYNHETTFNMNISNAVIIEEEDEVPSTNEIAKEREPEVVKVVSEVKATVQVPSKEVVETIIKNLEKNAKLETEEGEQPLPGGPLLVVGGKDGE